MSLTSGKAGVGASCELCVVGSRNVLQRKTAMFPVNQIVAVDEEGGIGKESLNGYSLPWRLPGEFKRFAKNID